jgi:hypothetical protein
MGKVANAAKALGVRMVPAQRVAGQPRGRAGFVPVTAHLNVTQEQLTSALLFAKQASSTFVPNSVTLDDEALRATARAGGLQPQEEETFMAALMELCTELDIEDEPEQALQQPEDEAAPDTADIAASELDVLEVETSASATWSSTAVAIERRELADGTVQLWEGATLVGYAPTEAGTAPVAEAGETF